MGVWINKLWWLHAMVYYSAIIKKQTIETQNNGQYSGNYAEWNKPAMRSHILLDSMYVTFLKGQNYRNGEQISGCQRSRMGKGVQKWVWHQEMSYGDRSVLYQCQYPGFDIVL